MPLNILEVTHPNRQDTIRLFLTSQTVYQEVKSELSRRGYHLSGTPGITSFGNTEAAIAQVEDFLPLE